MNLKQLQKLVMQQAKEKGFGTKPKDIVVSEKIVLIHSEISEAYDAFLKRNLDGKGGFYEELGDVLQRVLHLGSIFGISFVDRKISSNLPIHEAIAKLHLTTSLVWENYRHQKVFKRELQTLVSEILALAQQYSFSLEEVVCLKLTANKTRVWAKEKMNEKFT